MDAQNLFRTIRYNWLLIVVGAVLGAAFGTLLASITDREYSATAELFVTVSTGGSTGELAQGSNYSQQQARNFSAVATREIVLGPVIDDLGLDSSVEGLKQRVRVSVPLNTSMISIEVTDPAPDQAALIANSVAKNLAIAVDGLAPEIADLNESPVRLQVVERAAPPTSPAVPNVPLWILLGAAAGIVLGVAWMTVREFLVAKIRSREQVDAATGLSHLGSVSLDRSARRRAIVISADPFSTRAEEYRQLRSSLRFLSPGSAHKAFVITSSVPSEGKSTTAANLAQAIAISGQSVCLVEADLRRPSLGEILDLDGSIGLTTVLAGEATIEEVTQEWGENGLKVILAGGLPPNPSELLESATAELVFSEIQSKYAVTILDSPPLNAVADTSALSRIFGGVLLVVGVKRVQLRELRRAVEHLTSVNVPIHGYILNGTLGSRRHQPYYRSAAVATRTAAPATPARSAEVQPADTAEEDHPGEPRPGAGEAAAETQAKADTRPTPAPVPRPKGGRPGQRSPRSPRSPRTPEPTETGSGPEVLTGAETH